MQTTRFTSVTIAHRLSTIKHADQIAVVNRGVVVEKGTYNDLIEIGDGGIFYALAAKQEANMKEDEDVINHVQQERADATRAQLVEASSDVQRAAVMQQAMLNGTLEPHEFRTPAVSRDHSRSTPAVSRQQTPVEPAVVVSASKERDRSFSGGSRMRSISGGKSKVDPIEAQSLTEFLSEDSNGVPVNSPSSRLPPSD
eukprot:4038436-Prymnesium_polylepis.1